MNGWMLTTGSFGPRAPRRDLLPRGLPQLRQRGQVLHRVDVVRLQRGPRDLLRRGFMLRLGRHMTIFTTGVFCSAMGVVIYLRVRACPRARRRWRRCIRGGGTRRWLVNVSSYPSGGVGAIVGRVRGRGALRVNDGPASCHESLGVSASEIGKRQGAFAGAAGKSHNDARARRSAVAAARCAIAPTRMRPRPN